MSVDRTDTKRLLDATAEELLRHIPDALGITIIVAVPGAPGSFMTVSAARGAGSPAMDKRTFWRAIAEVAVGGMRETEEAPAARH